MKTFTKSAVEQGPIEFKVENYNAIVKQFDPLINKFSYAFYQKYNTVLDFEDARQEVLLCLYRCLSKYSAKQYKFITYFYAAFNCLSSRHYWSYFHQINLAMRKDESSMASDGKRVISGEDDETNSDERFVDNSYKQHDIRPYLTDQSAEVYDVYIKHFKVSPWLISQDLGISRYHAKERYDQFRRELQKLYLKEYNVTSDK